MSIAAVVSRSSGTFSIIERRNRALRHKMMVSNADTSSTNSLSPKTFQRLLKLREEDPDCVNAIGAGCSFAANEDKQIFVVIATTEV